MKPIVRMLVASGAGLAVLATTAAASAATADHSRHGRDGKHHRLLSPEQRQILRATGHIEVVKHTRKHGDVTLEVQRGTVTALSPTSITLLSKDGYSHAYVLTAKTIVREKGKRESLSALMPDERVMVVAVHGPGGDTARSIGCLRGPRARASRG